MLFLLPIAFPYLLSFSSSLNFQKRRKLPYKAITAIYSKNFGAHHFLSSIGKEASRSFTETQLLVIRKIPPAFFASLFLTLWFFLFPMFVSWKNERVQRGIRGEPSVNSKDQIFALELYSLIFSKQLFPKEHNFLSCKSFRSNPS